MLLIGVPLIRARSQRKADSERAVTARSLVHNDSSATGEFTYAHVNQTIDHMKKLQDFFTKEKEQANGRLGESTSRPVEWDDWHCDCLQYDRDMMERN